VALDAIAGAERRRQSAQHATKAEAERQGAEVLHMLPATAETLSRSLELAVRDRDFLRSDEIAEARLGCGNCSAARRCASNAKRTVAWDCGCG